MKHETQNDLEAPRVLREYLLGKLSDDWQQRIEERLMTDQEFLEHVRAAEDELADEYAVGFLAGAEKEAVEKVFLAHPSRHRHSAFARALQRYVGTAGGMRPVRGTRFRAVLIAASLLIAVGGVWISWTAMRLRHERDAIAVEQSSRAEELQRERAERAQLENQIRELKAVSAARESAIGIMAVTLVPGLVRDASAVQRIVIPSDKAALRLELLLENGGYRAYDAVLEKSSGEQIWSEKGLQQVATGAGKAVIVLLSFESVPPQDYVLRLAGVRADGRSEPAASYYFGVAAK